MSNAYDHPEARTSAEDAWDVFELDDEMCEPEPERGDFWEEMEDDYGHAG
jgi:hypothetical protein